MEQVVAYLEPVKKLCEFFNLGDGLELGLVSQNANHAFFKP